jgi:hypothetical protein
MIFAIFSHSTFKAAFIVALAKESTKTDTLPRRSSKVEIRRCY